MEEICFNVTAGVAGIAANVVTVASVLANILPNAGTTSKTPIKIALKLVNYLAINFKVNTDDKNA